MLLEIGLNGSRQGHVLGGRRTGADLGDQTRLLRITGFGEEDFVARPGEVALDTVAGFCVKRGVDALRRCGHLLLFAPSDRLCLPIELLHPDLTQDLHRWQVPQRLRSVFGIDGVEQGIAILQQ